VTPPPPSGRVGRHSQEADRFSGAVQAWITAVGAKTAYIERGSPWENGYVESFNARQAFLDHELGKEMRFGRAAAASK
jgi:hypothetical protein